MNITKDEVCSTIQGTVGTSSETQDTATFVDEACVSAEVGGLMTEGRRFKNQLMSVEDYLARPIRWLTFDLASGVTAFIVDRSSPPAVAAWNRLRGALGYRMTLKFRLQVVASPFSSGLYKMFWVPQHFHSRIDTAQLAHLSQTKGVEINLQDNTEAELIVPYTHFVDYLPTRQSDWVATDRYGTLYVAPMIPAFAGGSVPSVSATLWVSMHDIEIEGKTAYNVIDGTIQSFKVYDGNVQAYGAVISGVAAATGVAAKVSETVFSKLSANAKETKEENGTMAKVANVGGMLSRVIGNTAWFAEILGQTAMAFGFSRPIIKEPLKYVRRSTWFNPGQDVGLDVLPLATQTDCTIKCIKGIGSDVDEMALVNFVSVPSAIGRFDMTPAKTENAVLFYTDVTPMACFYNASGITNKNNNPAIVTATGSLGLLYPSPLFYAGQSFAQWRGSIKFTFKVAKTRYHSGRLKISYLPYAQQTTSTAVKVQDFSLPIDNITKIWDLRESSECEFVCPYMAPWYWTQNFQVSGTLAVEILEQLIAPDTVTQTLTFLVYASGEKDFEFSMPIAPRFTPLTTSESNYQVANFTYPGSGPSTLVSIEDGVIESNSLVTQDREGSQVTIGESILSIKQLISRPSYRQGPSNSFDGGRGYSHWWGETIGSTLTTLDSSTTSYWASAFAYARGGTIIRLVPTVSNVKNYIITLFNTKGPTQTSVQNDGLASNCALETVSTNSVVLPFYQMTSKVPTCGSYSQIRVDTASPTSTPYFGWGVFNRAWYIFGARTSSAAASTLFSVSAADDSQLFWQMPCPPCQPGTITTGANYYGKGPGQFTQQNAVVNMFVANF